MAPARPRSSRGPTLLLALGVLGTFEPFRSFVSFGSLSRHSASLSRAVSPLSRAAEATQLSPDVAAVSNASAEPFSAVEKLYAKLPWITGRTNTTDGLNFKVKDTKVGTSVKLMLPPLQCWQYFRRSKKLHKRQLPSFKASADTLAAAKEQAAEAALSALFRTLNTRLSSRNNRDLSKVMAGIFNDGVELAQIRFEGDVEEGQSSPGNFLYTLAYLSRQTSAADPQKRILTVSQVNSLPLKPGWLQAMVQQKQRLVMPPNISTEMVSADTKPTNLAAYMEKALRQSGALKLQTAGTKAAEQALLALKALNQRYAHRFSCYFAHGNFQNATGLEVHVARRWRPLTE